MFKNASMVSDCCNCIYVYLYMDNSLELDLIDVLQLILYNVPLFVY